MGSSDVDFRAAESDRLDLLRWFCGTLLGICGAGGVVACLTARVCFGDSRGWQSFAEITEVLLFGGGLALIAGIPAVVLGSLFLDARSHLPGKPAAADGMAWSLICGGGAGAASMLLSGLPTAVIFAAVTGGVGGFTGYCLLDAVVGAGRTWWRKNRGVSRSKEHHSGF
ncbi:MAG: hypothetical protein ACKPHU_11365 [Planctomycetaceae bacterium]